MTECVLSPVFSEASSAGRVGGARGSTIYVRFTNTPAVREIIFENIKMYEAEK